MTIIAFILGLIVGLCLAQVKIDKLEHPEWFENQQSNKKGQE
jgi:hypothetical protein